MDYNDEIALLVKIRHGNLNAFYESDDSGNSIFDIYLENRKTELSEYKDSILSLHENMCGIISSITEKGKVCTSVPNVENILNTKLLLNFNNISDIFNLENKDIQFNGIKDDNFELDVWGALNKDAFDEQVQILINSSSGMQLAIAKILDTVLLHLMVIQRSSKEALERLELIFTKIRELVLHYIICIEKCITVLKKYEI